MTGVFRVAMEGHKTQARGTAYGGMDCPLLFTQRKSKHSPPPQPSGFLIHQPLT